jgi:hypothetical protein
MRSQLYAFGLIAIFALLPAIVMADDDEEIDNSVAEEAGATPLIVIHKTVSEANVKVGADVLVKVLLTNEGDASAFNVEFNGGGKANTKSAAELEAGKSLEIEYKVATTKIEKKTIGLATATYLAKKDDKETLSATSNLVGEELRDETKMNFDISPRGFVNVVSDAEYDRLTTRYIVETIFYSIFAAVACGFPFVAYKQKQMQVDMHLRESRKK